MSWEYPEKKVNKRSGTRKIADLPKEAICRHPDHEPPGHIVLPPGVYEHTCPGCGKTIQFVVKHPPTL
jgi:hypothetical protein